MKTLKRIKQPINIVVHDYNNMYIRKYIQALIKILNIIIVSSSRAFLG